MLNTIIRYVCFAAMAMAITTQVFTLVTDAMHASVLSWADEVSCYQAHITVFERSELRFKEGECQGFNTYEQEWKTLASN